MKITSSRKRVAGVKRNTIIDRLTEHLKPVERFAARKKLRELSRACEKSKEKRGGR